MKYLLIPVALLFIGCSDSKTYQDFQKLHGADEYIHCNEAGFLVRDVALRSQEGVSRSLVINDADVPTRCNVDDIKIKVKETVATGALSGSVQ